MDSPTSYAGWTKCFDVLKTGTDDERTIISMEGGTISWTSGVAERFSDQLFEVVNHRLEALEKRFQRNLGFAMGSEAEIINALLGVRKEFIFLKRLTCLSTIPSDISKHFLQLLVEYAQNTQRSLEDSAKEDWTGRLGIIVKNNRIDNI